MSQTKFFQNSVFIQETASIVGPKEADGPISGYFDRKLEDDLLGQKTYELAESKLHALTIRLLLNKAKLNEKDIDLCIGGDLTDEIYCSNFAMRDFDIPFLGMYSACATFGATLISAALYIYSGQMNKVVCSTTSHFSSAERQYRFPLEFGNQRTPLAQWTVTGCGASLLNNKEGHIKLESATIGKIVDFGVSDVNNMGAAMAPAAMKTILSHLEETSRDADYYDLIATGDLGDGGLQLLKEIAKDEGIRFDKTNCTDCGILIFNREAQKVGQGGSGAGCSSAVFNGYIYNKMIERQYRNVLLVPTGALISKTSSLQGQTIPGIAHAISFERI
ncbi:MAG: stage V sporulation protein AD [Christensenellaceae bacterium]|jgi:stage V sporulation protein AD|nr:stage V sporulation protein AD [Christensenellaceae bacterium]